MDRRTQTQSRLDWKPRVIQGDDEDFVDLAYPYNTSVMYELMALALQANLTNVITFGHPGGNRLFPFDGITYGYHSLTHHGKRPDLLKELTIIETFYTKQFAGFLDLLKKNKDSEDRPLLDSTVVMFGSGMGNASSHSSRNLPVMVTGGGLKGGNHHRFERKGRDGRPLCDLSSPFFRNLAWRPTVLHQFGQFESSAWMRKLVLGLTAGLLVAGTVSADKADLVRPFLETYCIKCHGEDKQKGDRRFDHLTGNPKTLDEAEGLQEVLDQLNLAEMPRKTKSNPSRRKPGGLSPTSPKFLIKQERMLGKTEGRSSSAALTESNTSTPFGICST